MIIWYEIICRTCYISFSLIWNSTNLLHAALSLSLSLIVIILPSYTTAYIYKFLYQWRLFFTQRIERKLEHSTNRSLAMPAPTFSVLTFGMRRKREEESYFFSGYDKKKYRRRLSKKEQSRPSSGVNEKKQLYFVSSLNTSTVNWIGCVPFSQLIENQSYHLPFNNIWKGHHHTTV